MRNKFIIISLLITALNLPKLAVSYDWYIYDHDLTTENLNFIDINGFFAVGNNGVVLVCLYPTSTRSDPYWEDVSPSTTVDLFGAIDDENTHVVGASGTIIYSEYFGYSWIFIDSPTDKDLYSITTIADDDYGFIVGAEGTILYGGGDPPVWELYEPSPTNQDLYTVCGDAHPSDPNTTWAVGAGGTILDYEDGVWSLYPSSPTTEDLYGVYVDNYYDVAWACGAGGTILNWDGASWNIVDTPTTEDLYCIWDDPYEVFCVGANGTILYSTDGGLTWEIEDCPVSVGLHGVAGYIPIWAVGEGGTILSNEPVGGNIQPISVGKVKALFAPSVEAAGSKGDVKEK